jgi:hypothetical protein
MIEYKDIEFLLRPTHSGVEIKFLNFISRNFMAKLSEIDELESYLERKVVNSMFLDEHYSTEWSNRDEDNLKDAEGARLSHYWKYNLKN